MVDELTLIGTAQTDGRSWDQIGKLLGVPTAVAKTRPATLRRAIDDLNRI